MASGLKSFLRRLAAWMAVEIGTSISLRLYYCFVESMIFKSEGMLRMLSMLDMEPFQKGLVVFGVP